jgi:hypothetical protein
MDEARSRDDADLYDRDFTKWAEVQACHLRDDRLDLLDKVHLIEEIESLGKSQLFALRSSYALIAMHLLKQLKQPGKATASWENTINRERGNVSDLLDENPGLKPKREEAFVKAYGKARSDAAFETKIDIRKFPVEPPFTLQQLESRDWWPQGFPRTGERERSRAGGKRQGTGIGD